jgi:hypothetical protein
MAAVVLLPETYNPIPGKDSRLLKRALTDAQGRYRFSGIEAGVYNLEAKDTIRILQALIQGIKVDSGVKSGRADGILGAAGTLEIPFMDRYLPENAQAYIPGTTYHTFTASKVNTQGILVLGNIQAGLYKDMLVMSPDLPGGGPISIAGNFHIGPGASTRLTSLQDWLFSTRLKLDPSGITVPLVEPLDHFPVLVRLNSQNFNFSQARGNGEDIRFIRTDGSRLPHQIERWDLTEKTAAIWVLVDSIPRRTVDSSVIMRWGRVDALDVSNGGQVFDTAQGFSSVWHLAEPSNTTVGGYHDATANAKNATAIAPNFLRQVSAVAGMGKQFVDIGGQMTAALAPQLGGNASFTVTFWMKFQMTPYRMGLLNIGQETENMGFHFLIKSDTMAQFGPWALSPDPINDAPSIRQNHFSLVPFIGKWTHVATVYDAEKQTLSSYINGESVALNSLSALNLEATAGVSFGRKIQSQSNMQGVLDEVRFYHRALPESWIRMEYATQKENSSVISLP